MASKVRIELNHATVRRLLRGEGEFVGVLHDLEERARRVAELAGPGMEPSVYVGPARARSGVITATADAIVAEARDRALTRAIDAAR
jgi:hypothetical protein